MRSHGIRRTRLLTVLLLASWAVSCGDRTELPSVPGAPPILLGDVQQIDSLLTARQGQWTLVNFWATWCRPCVAEIPALVALGHELEKSPFALVGVSLDFMVIPEESTAVRKVAEFGARYRVPYANLIYTGNVDALTERFNLSGVIPVTLLFDPRGHEVERWVGVLNPADLDRIRVHAN